MAGTDQIVFNTRERALSDDVNDVQSLKDRSLLDTFLDMFLIRQDQFGAVPSELPAAVVFGGLNVQPNGNDLEITAGSLAQFSTTLPPTPGTLDSDYRWASIRSPIAVVNPGPGANTWYLVEVQMVEVIASTTIRDIWDVGLGAFVPTSVTKRTERRLQAQLVAGTTTDLPVPTGGDWLPIAGVLVPTGGGAIPTANIIDLRRLWTDVVGMDPARERGLRKCNLFHVGPTALQQYAFECEAIINQTNVRLWLNTDVAGFDLIGDLTRIVAAGETPQAGSNISNFYLSTFFGLPVRNAYAWDGISNVTGNGLLVWATTAVGSQQETNGGALTLPSPFAAYAPGVGEIVQIGHSVTQAGAPVQLAMSGTNRQVNLQSNFSGTPLLQAFVPTGGFDTLTFPTTLGSAKSVRWSIKWEDNPLGSTDEEITVRNPSASHTIFTARANWNEAGMVEFEAPIGDIQVEFDGADVPPSAVANIVAWSL